MALHGDSFKNKCLGCVDEELFVSNLPGKSTKPATRLHI